MAEKTVVISVPKEKPIKISKWKVKEGAFVTSGQIILLYVEDIDSRREIRKFKANKTGTVKAIKVREGEVATPGCVLIELAACTHSTVMKDMCAECGADLRADNEGMRGTAAIVPMVHSVPELKVSEELARKLGREDNNRLLSYRKLVLLVDLDQTLVHTTNENIPCNIKGVHHYQLRSPSGPPRWYHTRLRPGTERFLEAAATRYELHVCTFGARQYAHAVARLLDPSGQYFSHRILSRDECFDARAKAANLKALFPCGDNLVCIIDDREDVWRYASNLIHVRPYSFFEHTGDINAPPGPDLQDPNLASRDLMKPRESSNPEAVINGSAEMPSLDPDPDTNKPPELPNVEAPNEKPPPLTVNEEYFEKNEAVTSPKEPEKMEAESVTETKKDNIEIVDKVINKDVVNEDNLEAANTNKTKGIEKYSAVQDGNVAEVENKAEVEKETKTEDVKEGGVESGSLEKKVETASLEGDENKEKEKPKGGDGMIEVDDPDDYLLYLEDILQRIHKYFYELYDRMESGKVPDLKLVIPEVRSQVLAGTSIVFSGLVPTQQRLESSRAYLVARSLGAEITQDFTERTTHLVAVRPGTAKVNSSRRTGSRPLVVTPDWLWACAERWERADEALFPLQRGVLPSARRPPPHCSSPPHGAPPPPTAAARHRTPSGRFMDTINPLLSFSRDDIADMDREVEDIFNESDESDAEQEAKEAIAESRLADDADQAIEKRLQGELGEDSWSDSSAESLSGGKHPHGWGTAKRTERKRRHSTSSSSSVDSQRHQVLARHASGGKRRPEPQDADSTLDGPPSDRSASGSDEPADEVDDREWNIMGAALEREFLGWDK